MSESGRHDWRKRNEKHLGLSFTAKALEEEQKRLEEARVVVDSAESNIAGLLERYKQQLDETDFIELPRETA